MSDQLRKQDREARMRVQAEFARPLVIEAGAGTGKTAALVARVLRWALDPGWKRAASSGETLAAREQGARVWERVVAITFTERAASEMSDRIASGLVALRQGRAPVGLDVSGLVGGEALADRCQGLLESLDLLNVSTIHAFCFRILAEHGFVAGMHPRLEVDADGQGLRSISDAVIVERLAMLYGDPGGEGAEVATALAANRIGPSQLLTAVSMLAAGADVMLPRDPFGPTRIAATTARLQAAAGEVVGLLARAFRGVRDRRASRALEATAQLQLLVSDLPGCRDAASLQAAVDSQRMGVAQRCLLRWSRGQLTQTESKHLGRVAQPLARASTQLLPQLRHLVRVDAAVYQQLATVLPPLLSEVRQRANVAGLLSFDQVVTRAVQVLQEHAPIRRRLQRRIDQLLVDEFQDTDDRQCALVSALALDGPPEQRPGLMIVGDPKQSIYGFRGADLGAYQSLVDTAVEANGEQHSLAVNYRSTPAILDEVRRIMQPVMRAEPGIQPDFVDLLPASGEPGTGEPPEYWVAWDANSDPAATTATRARELEALALARDLLRQHRAGVPWHHFAVLLRATTHQEAYLSVLRGAGIPYTVERDRNYFRRREVIDAVSLWRAIIDPHDQVALFALLRSPLVGVPDGALAQLWAQGLAPLVADADAHDQAWRERFSDFVAATAPHVHDTVPVYPGWSEQLVRAVEDLAQARDALRTDPFAQVVTLVRERFLHEVFEARRFLGAHRLANLERFYDGLPEQLAQVGGDLHALLRELRLSVTRQREAADAISDDAADAVRVMTIHQAKGLTFEQVFVLGLHSRPRGERLGDRSELVTLPSGAVEGCLVGYPSLDYDQVQQRRSASADAEAVRALYVAITRPRQRLVLSGAWPKAKPERYRSHADLLCERLQPSALVAALAEASKTGEPLAEVDGARVRFVALEDAPLPRDAGSPPSEASLPAQDLSVARRHRYRSLNDRPRVVAATSDNAGSPQPSPRGPNGTGRAPHVAALLGIGFHRAIERMSLDVPLAGALKDAAAISRTIVDHLPADPAHAATLREQLTELLVRFRDGPLAERWDRLRGASVAREMAMFAPTTDHGPVISGSLDWLTKDAAELVVVDFKTDSVVGADGLTQAVSKHSRQAERYAAAVSQAFGQPTRAELWWVRRGVFSIVRATGG